MSARDLGITFAGGGNRSFYQFGFWNRWGDRLLPRVAAIASCSAGACVATFILSGRAAEAKAFWNVRRRGVAQNFYWKRLLRGERPTPHAPIYRDTLVHAFADGGLDRIRATPFPVLVLTTVIPRRLPALGAMALGLTAYSLEKALREEMLHPTWGRRLGFAPAVFDARDCETPEALANLVIASSATPPFTPLGAFGGCARLLDGGVIDNAPAFLADGAPGVRRNLVLLTRPYGDAAVGRRGTRLYLAPRAEVPVERWDYTRPERIDATIAMGEREAADHAPLLEAFLGGVAGGDAGESVGRAEPFAPRKNALRAIPRETPFDIAR